MRFRYFQLRLLWLEQGVVNVQKIIGFTKLNLIQPWREVLLDLLLQNCLVLSNYGNHSIIGEAP